MGHGRGHGHGTSIAKPGDKGVDHGAGGAVTFDQRDLCNFAGGLHTAIGDRQFELQRLGGGLIFDHTDDVCSHTIGPMRGVNREIITGKSVAHIDGFAGRIGPVEMRTFDKASAVLCHDLTTGNNSLYRQGFEV